MVSNLFFSNVTKLIGGNRMGFVNKLLDKDNNQVSTTNFFVLAITVISFLLLLMPVFVLVIEAWYNHTISTDLSGLAAYIGAVASMIIGVGLTKAWTVVSDNKLKGKQIDMSSCDDVTLD